MFCLLRIPGSPTWSQKVQGFIFTAWFCLWIQQTSGADVITAAVGETVTLLAPVTGRISSYTWYRGTAAVGDQAILTYFGPSGPQTTGAQYTGRETGLSDGSLEIRDVLANYTGNYTRSLLVVGGSPVTLTQQLRVYEKVPKPIVGINVSQPTENQNVALTCGNSNAASTILWFFNNRPLQPDNNRLTLSSENKTLTISRISKSDDGSYQCEAQNPVSRSISDLLTVTVTVPYGPNNLAITPSPNVELKLGNELGLTCTAASFPAAQYQWLHNNTNINTPQSTYTKARSTYDDSGTYTCVASNSVTGLSANVSAIMKISATPHFWIQSTYGQESRGADAITATVGQTVTITVELSGTIITYTWYRGTAVLKDQAILTYSGPSNPQVPGPQYTGHETGLSNGFLQIRDVLANFTGNYTLNVLVVGATPITHIKQLVVCENVPKPIVRINVSEPIENQPVALTCENSNSATTILWFFNNKPLQPDNNRLTLSADKRTLTISRISRSDAGSYQCEAENPVSHNTSDPLTVIVSLTGPPLCNRCSCWEVTLGVAIGVFLCATAVIGGVVFYYKRLLNQKETRKDDFTYHNHSINQKPETQYENVTKGHKMHLANQPTGTESPYMGLQHGDQATYEQIKR